MKIAIMQPYFCAYIGYYQLINAVDKFVICDDLQYTRKGWFNRNRILDNGTDRMFTIPIKKAERCLNVNLRYLAANSIKERIRILKQIQYLYQKAPFFSQNYPLVERLFINEIDNLFDFIHFSVVELCFRFDIKTPIILSSSLNINSTFKSQDRILEICNILNTNIYINPIGGKELYDKKVFKRKRIELRFIKANKVEYAQFNHEFVPWLSIIDILMFNDIEQIKSYLNEYKFEEPI